MEKPKRHFLFNLEWDEILSELPKEVKYEVYDAIIEYAKSGKLLDLKPIAKGCFLFIRKELDYYSDSYKKKSEVRKEAGSKGGNAKQNKQNVANVANATFAKQNKQKVAKGSINKNENKNKNDSEDKSSSSPLTPRGGAEGEDELKRQIEIHKHGKPIWKESILMKFGISETEADRYLDEFYLDMRCREYNVQKVSALFTGWLAKKLTDEKNGKPAAKSDPRRGTDVGDHQAEDYGGAF